MTRLVIGTPTAAYRSPTTVTPCAFYCLGSSQVSGMSFAVGDDLMGGSPLTRFGSNNIDHGYYSTSSDTDYWKTPFTADTLVNSESTQHGCTVLFVGRAAAGAAHTAISSYSSSASPCIDLSLKSANLSAGLAQPNSRQAQFANDANRGSRWAMYAAMIQPTQVDAAERRAGAALQTVSTGSFASQTIGGGLFWIGNRSDLSSDGLDFTLAAFWGHALTPTELNQVYSDLDTWLTPLGATLS